MGYPMPSTTAWISCFYRLLWYRCIDSVRISRDCHRDFGGFGKRHHFCFFAPALALWALIQVLSMLISCISASNARSLKIFSKIPASCHFTNRLYTVCQGPYLSGRSLQAAPLRRIQQIPFSIFRWSTPWSFFRFWEIRLYPLPFIIGHLVPSNHWYHWPHLWYYIRHHCIKILLVCMLCS